MARVHSLHDALLARAVRFSSAEIQELRTLFEKEVPSLPVVPTCMTLLAGSMFASSCCRAKRHSGSCGETHLVREIFWSQQAEFQQVDSRLRRRRRPSGAWVRWCECSATRCKESKADSVPVWDDPRPTCSHVACSRWKSERRALQPALCGRVHQRHCRVMRMTFLHAWRPEGSKERCRICKAAMQCYRMLGFDFFKMFAAQAWLE